MIEYVGAIHIHSTYSDGSGTVDEIIKTAQEVDLDYIILTDHNTLRAKKEGKEGWHGDTFLLVGAEINDKQNLNHYLALGIDKPFSTRMSAKDYVEKVKEKGGIGFIAHPHEERSSMKEHPPYPWNEWDSEDFTGIEIWNHMSEWMEGLNENNKYNYFVHPLKSIISPTKKSLAKWDELNLKRKVVGIGGIDAHAHKINLMGFIEVEVFPYKVLFKSIRTHLLCDTQFHKSNNGVEFAKDRNQILKSLESGRVFFSNYYHGDAKGFRFFAQDSNMIYHMGDYVKFSDKIRLRVILPNISGTIKLIANGSLIDEVENIDAEFIIQKPGVYRVEIFLDGKAWIYSNHIRIGL
ncbi:MAG: PHP domain-containing protein [Melioribacteraceae bacterium]|jgi:hypothetical protein|nr:PHP domain-containing protein [Melioribacteraceae bacterium]